MIVQGLTLTVLGMAIVFLFLTLLVFVMKLLAALVKKLLPHLKMEGDSTDYITAEYPKREVGQIQKDKGSPEIAAVIAGIQHYFPGTFHGPMNQEKINEVAAAIAVAYQSRQ